MQLLRLELKGFKSFADKTIVNFSSGLTAIVGPNGSGKSNITDAIRWVLGESNVRNLRGQKAEDIIFSGTAKRRALAVAEVSLIFDNADKTLPEELAEVAITRRLYRNGDSEFSINRRNCRLKDIHRLLADTGLGRDSMAIIGQNRIDAILNSKPEERRLIFEDVAGISGFKMNKEDAQRRISATERNMERVNDLLANLDEQLITLEEKAEQTRTYNALAKQKRVYDGALTFHEYKTAERIQTRLENENISLTAESDELRTSVDENEALRRQLADADEQRQIALQALEEKYGEVRQATERIHGQQQLLEEQERTLRRDVEERQSRLVELKTNFEAGTHRVLLLEKVIHDDILQLELKKAAMAEAETTYEEYVTRWEKENRSWQETDSADRERNEKLTEVLVAKEGVKAELQLLYKQLAENEELLQTIVGERDEAKAAYDMADALWQKSKATMAELEEEYQALAAKEQSYQAECLRIQQSLEATLRQMQQVEGRLQLLQNWEDSHEGYAEATKTVLKAKESWRQSLHGAVGELFSVEERLITAVEIALGASVNHIICDTTKSAAEAIAYLKSQHKGRATFLPIDAVRGTSTDTKATQETGIIGTAEQCVTYDAKYDGIFTYLLGRTLIADTLEHAAAVQKKYERRLRIVTLEGDLLQPGGSLTGGSITKRKGAVLQRKGERLALEGELHQLETQAKELRNELTELETEQQSLQKKSGTLADELRSLHLQVANEEGKVKAQEERASRKIQVFSETESRKVSVTQTVADLEHRIRTLEEEEISLRAATNSAKDREQLLQNVETLQRQKQEAHEVLTRLLLEVEHGARVVEEKKEQVEEQRENLSSYETRKQPLEDSTKEGTAKLETQIPSKLKELSEESVNCESEARRLELERKAAYETRQEEQQQQRVVTEELERIRQRQDLVQRRLVDMEGRLMKVRLDAEGALQKIDTLGYTREEAQQLRIDGNVQDWQKVQGQLSAEIDALGVVNPNAIEECEEAQQRRDFLQSQQNDLVEAKGQLETVIGEIDAAMSERFSEVFAIVSEGFQRIFERLFGGGTAQLVLIGTTNVLESGIEMYIQPPGKKRQQLTLLSGGERALTVIALLFAFLDYRPAPFCVLDEVDAALDESNVERFSRYLNQFGNETQFIVVTHRKPTMESANVLQGVTMAEQGVSQLLTVAFDDIKEEL